MVALFSFTGKSIKSVLRSSYFAVVILLCIPVIYTLLVTVMATSRYDTLITNVSRAAEINEVVRIEISDELWDIVAGNKRFEDGRQYEILDRLKNEIQDISASAKPDGGLNYLEIAFRAIRTLESYVDRLGEQLAQNFPVMENEAVLDEVRAVAAVVSDVLQEFIVSEISDAARTNEDIKNNMAFLSIILLVITLIIVLVITRTLIFVSAGIRRPIRAMEVMSSRIASGNFPARSRVPKIRELDNLAKNMNVMAGRLQKLLDENIREQQNLKKAEMKALQAQITPHFLYNTFDSIIWLAESGETEKVITITRAFSEFFRISLNRGKEWIPAAQELDHIRHYLTIQKIRYSDILDYAIEFDEGVRGCMVLKLSLQPLVENAIYHGIKNKRGFGFLRVTARLEDTPSGQRVRFCVEDNGIGFSPEKLADVLDELAAEKSAEDLSGVYGLYNVNKRLNLYYGDSVHLEIESEFGKGTRVWFSVPYLNAEKG